MVMISISRDCTLGGLAMLTAILRALAGCTPGAVPTARTKANHASLILGEWPRRRSENVRLARGARPGAQTSNRHCRLALFGLCSLLSQPPPQWLLTRPTTRWVRITTW